MENPKIEINHQDTHNCCEDILELLEYREGANSLPEFLSHRTTYHSIIAHFCDSQKHRSLKNYHKHLSLTENTRYRCGW